MKAITKLTSTLALASTILTLVLGTPANALPLVSESAAKNIDDLVTIYPDGTNPKQFYVFPNSSRMAKGADGKPMLSFVHWGLDNPAATKSGGYLTYSMHLDYTPEAKAAIEKFKAMNPDASISVLPVKRSVVGLTTTEKNEDGSPAGPLEMMIKGFTFPKHGGRAEDKIGVNSTLTDVGARVFRAIFEANQNQALNIDYCYAFEGLGPNMKALIVVEMRRIYDYFEANGGGGYLWWSVNVRRVVETLVKNKTITIRMDGGDAKEWEYINAITKTIVERLFKPELSATAGAGGSASDPRPFRLAVNSVHKEELDREEWNWERRDIVEREFCLGVTVEAKNISVLETR